MHAKIASLQTELEHVSRTSGGRDHHSEGRCSKTPNLVDQTPPAYIGVAATQNQSSDTTRIANFRGYSAFDAADAVRRGVDVRLVQDGNPIREHSAHNLIDPSQISISYEQCIELIAANKGKRSVKFDLPQHKIHWLHIPKCGSSFGALLYGLVCQAEPSPQISPHTGEPCDYCTYVPMTSSDSSKRFRGGDLYFRGTY